MSNLDTFDQIMATADLDRCLEYFSDMSESDRKNHTQRCLQWASVINPSVNCNYGVFKELEDKVAVRVASYQSAQDLAAEFSVKFDEKSLICVTAAALACCTLNELKHLRMRGLPDTTVAAKIMSFRKPAWLDKWCVFVVKEFSNTHWFTVFELEDNQLCSVPRNSDYWMAMLCSLTNIHDFYSKILCKHASMRDALLSMIRDTNVLRMFAEPGLLESEIYQRRWRQDGVEPYVARVQPSHLTPRTRSEVWSETLLQLAADKLVDESRLIECSFYALVIAGEKEARKSPYFTVSSAKFAIELNQELTKLNKAPWVTHYVSLLGATHTDVSLYAATSLLNMPKGTLDAAEICSCILPVFLNKSKEPAAAALKLLSRLVRENPSERFHCGTALIAAFGHSSKDLHKKALALIESTRALEDDNLLEEFLLRIDTLSGLERASALAIAAPYQSTAPDTTTTPPNVRDLDALLARADKLDNSLRDLARVNESITAARANRCSDVSVILDTFEYPRLDPTKTTQPIQTLDNLIYFYTKFWSSRFRMLDLCTLLDGVSRLCDLRPDDFAQKTDVLKQKALAVIKSYMSSNLEVILAYGMLRWLGVPATLDLRLMSGILFSHFWGEFPNHDPSLIGGTSYSFLLRICLGVAERVASGVAAPLLCAPTHRGGWIDPRILVERLLIYQSRNIAPDKVDFIQSLLRLAPDHRSEALATASACDGEPGEALRFALGDQAPQNIINPEYWVAAFRARSPHGVSEELRKFIPDHCPDGAVPAAYTFDLKPVAIFGNDRFSSRSNGLPNFLPPASDGSQHQKHHYVPNSFSLGKPAPNASIFCNYPLYPTVNLHENANWTPDFQSYTWLHNLESTLALYAKVFLQNIDSIGNYWQGDLEWLFDADTSMTANGRYVIALAMSSKNSDLSRLAVDLLIAAIAECRITATAYGEAMTNLLPGEVITMVRWIKGIREAAKTSAQHAAFCWLAVSTTLTSKSITTSQQIFLMELLVELQIEYAFTLSLALNGALTMIAGNGKATKLAKTLLQSKGRADRFYLASLQDLESRISRVERWQKLQHVI